MYKANKTDDMTRNWPDFLYHGPDRRYWRADWQAQASLHVPYTYELTLAQGENYSSEAVCQVLWSARLPLFVLFYNKLSWYPFLKIHVW